MEGFGLEENATGTVGEFEAEFGVIAVAEAAARAERAHVAMVEGTEFAKRQSGQLERRPGQLYLQKHQEM